MLCSFLTYEDILVYLSGAKHETVEMLALSQELVRLAHRPL